MSSFGADQRVTASGISGRGGLKERTLASKAGTDTTASKGVEVPVVRKEGCVPEPCKGQILRKRGKEGGSKR